jgi:hypothetical protein
LRRDSLLQYEFEIGLQKQNMLSKFQHDNPKHPQDAPSRYGTPVNDTKTQYTTRDETDDLH